MTTTMVSHNIKQITGGLALIRRTLIAGALAPFLAFSLAGCNGKVFSSLYEDPNKDLLPLLLSGTNDVTAPVITSVTSTTANGGYGIGSSINITVNFSEPVTLAGGSLNVTLDTGDVISVSAGAYPASQFSGTYTVATGDESADLDCDPALVLTGGSITDLNSNIMTNFSVPDTQTLADNKDIEIDGIVPTISLNATPNITAANETTYTVSGNCSEDGQMVSVIIGGTVNAAPTCVGGTFTTSPLVVSGIADGTSISITADISDPAGNDATQASAAVDKDTEGPTVAIGAPSATHVNDSGTISYGITYTGADTVNLTPAGIALTTTGGATCTAGVTGGTTTTPTVTLSGCAGNGTVRISVAAGTSADTAGNPNEAEGPGVLVTVDTIAPGVTGIVRNTPSSSTTNATSVVYTVTFSENVSGVDTSDFTLSLSGVTATIASVSASSGSSIDVTVNSISGSGTIRLDLNGSGTGIIDAASNEAAGYSSGELYTIDQTLPAVTGIVRNTPASAATNADSVLYTVTFSENVSGVDISDFTLTRTGTANGIIASVSASSGTSFDVTVNSITGDGTIRLDLNDSGTGIVDNDSNPADGYTSGQVYTIDNTAPSVTSIVRTTPSAATTNATTVIYTVTFNESVSGIDTSDFALFTGGTAAGTIDSVSSSSGSSITVTVDSVSGDGSLRLDLDSSGTGITDGVSNAISGGYTSGEVYTLDHTAPYVTGIARNTPAAATTNATTVIYTVTFNESVSGIDTADFALTTTGSAAGTIASVSSSSGSSIDVTINTVSGDGTMRLDLKDSGTGITDAATNAISGGYTSGGVYTLDHTAPYVTGIARNTPADETTNATSVIFTVTFNESVSGIDAADFTLTNGGTATGTINSVSSSSGSSITVTVNPVSGDGTLRLDLRSSGTGITDGVSNAISGGYTSGEAYTLDHTAPYVTGIARNTPSAATTNATTVIYTVTFNESVSGVDASDFSLTTGGTAAGTIASVSSSSGSSIDVTVNTVSGDGTMRLDLKDSGTGITDGVSYAITGGYTSGEAYTLDHTPPVVSIDLPAALTKVSGIETVSFSDDGSSPQLSVNSSDWVNASSGITALDDITGWGSVGQGNFTLYLRDTDAAGNTGSDSITLTKDTEGPVITSAETGDVNTDTLVYPDHIFGRIDYYKITFNEFVNDEDFPGYVENGVGETPAQTDWIVQGYNNVRLVHGTAATTELGVTDTPNDNVIYIKFDEGSSYDTAATPNLYTTATPGLTDTVPSGGNAMAAVASGELAAAGRLFDEAGPVIVSFTGITGTTAATITFSEGVDGAENGGCVTNLTRSSFGAYINDGAGGASDFTISDGAACDGKIEITLNANLETTDLNADKITVASDTAVYDVWNNPASSSVQVAASGKISPKVLYAEASSTTSVRITYSEPVDATDGTNGARNWSNYSFTPAAGTYTCTVPPAQGTALAELDTSQVISEITSGVEAGTVFELPLTAELCSATTYTLTVTGPVKDTTYDAVLVAPKYGSFPGYEKLKISAASQVSTTSFLVKFNKAVVAGSGNSDENADNIANYKLTGNGSSDIGTLSTATRSVSDHRNVTIEHTLPQRARMYTIIGANGLSGDGFDNASGVAIKADGITEYLQPQSDDRANFQGLGAGIEYFSDGPIAQDPYGDGSTFGYLAKYNGQLYIGPNKHGNDATRMDPDGANPQICTFEFTQDNTGTWQSDNSSVTTPDTYETIGFTGCDPDNADPNEGCGPNNEDGRALFTSGTMGTTEHLFISGTRSGGYNYYLYWTTDTGTILNYNYIDLYDTFQDGDSLGQVGGNIGQESVNILGGSIYWVQPGNLRGRPYFTKINSTTAESVQGTDSDYMVFRFMTGIGAYSATKPNYADRIGGTTYIFNNQIYFANNGSVSPSNCAAGSTAPTCTNNGGVVRTTGTYALDPRPCTSADAGCADWVDITPTSTDYTHYFSKVITNLTDLQPSDRPVPAFAEFNGNLYMIRNACTINLIDPTCTCRSGYSSACNDDDECPAANRVPQLWKCTPGGDGYCDSGDWSLVAQNGSTGRTDFGDTDNSHITILTANGSNNLYIGFDNAVDGVKVYSSTGTNRQNPTSESDFIQVPGTNGDSFGIKTCGDGDDPCYTKLYSAISLPLGIDNYLYISGGNNSGPVAVFRQKD